MLTAALERQSCLSSAEQWRRQAGHLRDHAQRGYLRPEQREALLAEAEACDRQADWWVAGADDYGPGSPSTRFEGLLQ